jgi:Tfp pilus assembly protein PilO
MSIFDRIRSGEFSVAELDEHLDLFREYQRYIYSALIFLVTLMMFFSMVYEDYKVYRKRSQELNTFKQALEVRRKKVLDKENVEKELARLKRLVEEKKNIFFTEQEAEAFRIHILHRLAESTGNQITSRQFPKNVSRRGDFLVYPVSIALEGDFQSLMAFIDTLEGYDKIVRVDSMSVSRRSINPVQLSVRMDIGVYGL